MAEIYDIGDAPTVTATFRSPAGVLTSPTAVTVKYRTPDGEQEDLSPSEVSTGVWSVTVPTIELHGFHHVKFFGTGALVAAEEIRFRVRTSRVV